MPEAGPLGRALDQPRDVGDDRLPVLAFDRPQHRRERRERVVGDLRRRPRQPRQQRGLAGVRQPDQPDVGQQFQPQLDPVRFPAGPLLGEPRRLPGRGRKPLVPVPAAPALGDHRPLPRLDQVDRAAIDSRRLRPGRHRDHPLLPPRPMPVRPFPMTPPLPPEVPAPFQRPQIPLREIANEHHVPPVPTIPTIGPTPRHMRLPPKRHAPIPAGPALNPDLRLVVHRDQRVDRVAESVGPLATAEGLPQIRTDRGRPSGGVGCHSAEAHRSREGEGHPAPPSRSRRSVVSENADRATLARRSEVNLAGPRRKDRVIAAEPGALAGPEPGPALAHDDLAAGDLLAGEDLDARACSGSIRARCGWSPALSYEPSVSSFAAGFFSAAGFFAAGFFAADLRSLTLTVTSSLVSSERWPAACAGSPSSPCI